MLPALDEPAARALALVVLAERPRAEVAVSLGVSGDELGTLLAAARKELRQTVVTLSGSGWCERAEGLISDRLDGVLADTDVPSARRPPAQLPPVRRARAPAGAGNRRAGDRPGRPPGAGRGSAGSAGRGTLEPHYAR